MAVNAVDLYSASAAQGQPQGDDDFERRRREARARMAAAMQQRPIQHVTQGLAQLGEVGLAAYDDYRATKDAKASKAEMADIMAQMYGGNRGGSVGGSTGPAVPKPDATLDPSVSLGNPLPPAAPAPIPADIMQNFGGPERYKPQEIASTGVLDPGMNAPGVQPPAPQSAPPTMPNPLSNFNAAGHFEPKQQQVAGVSDPPMLQLQPITSPPSLMAKGMMAGPPASTEGGVITSTPPQMPEPAQPQTGGLAPRYTDAIKKSEGFVPKAAWDYKQYTNGYGTRAQNPGETIDKPEAERRFNDEIGKARGMVDQFAPNAPEGVKAALASLTFNAGGKWMQSGLGQAVKAGDYETAQRIFTQYNKAGGQELPGLVNRRQGEAAWFKDQPQTAQAPAPQSKGMIQMAQAPSAEGGAMTPELFKRLALSNPALAQQLLLQDIKQKQAAPDQALEREGKQLQNKVLQKSLEEGKAPSIKEVGGNLLSVGPNGQVKTLYDAKKEAQPQVAANISGSLDSLSKIADTNNFEGAVGMYEGDPDSKLGAVGRFFGGSAGNEVRSQIQAGSDTLAAIIKPLIRAPGEGAWSDSDQAQLTRIVGNLTQANDKAEYMRRLEGVRDRVQSSFGITLPKIGEGGRGGPSGTGGNVTLPDGFKIRRLP